MNNINIKDIKFNLEQIAKGTSLIVTGVKPVKQYDENGKPNDKILGYSYDVVAPNAKYASFSIKVESKKPEISAEELEAAEREITAEPIGFVGKFYKTRTGDYVFTAKADSIGIVRG